MIFTQTAHLREMERLMQMVPRFKPRGHGIYIPKEITRTVSGTREQLLIDALSNIRHPAFIKRLNQYLNESEECPMDYRNEKHRIAFTEAVEKLNRRNFALMAALYIHYTEEQKEQARQTDIADLLRSQGETLKRSGKEFEWRDGGQKVTVRGNLWYHQYEQVGGDAIDFVRRFYNKSYPEAMNYLLGGGYGRLSVSPPMVKEVRPPVLPPQNDNMRRVYAYLLKHRNIDRDVLNYFAWKGLIYEDAKYHNVVFLGKDENGKVRHVHKRGSGSDSAYRGTESGSEPEYSFHYIGKSNRLYTFEAPIDMLSYISLHKENRKEHSCVALCSVADRAIFYTLKQHPQLNTVVLCLDSDEPGQTATHRIAEKLFTSGYHYEIEIPHGKDWNDDLRHPPMETEEEPAWAIQYS